MKRISWQRVIPAAEWLRTYNRNTLRKDILAGITVGVILVPQGMAYAILAGLPPVYGLYASVIPALVYPLFSSSRHLAIGPVALSSIIMLTGLSAFAEPGSPQFIAMAITLALIIGVMQFLLGVFRSGFMLNFLSRPVISGFTSAASIIIIFSQLKILLGIDTPRSMLIIEVIKGTIEGLDHIHWPTFGIGLGGIILIVLLKRIRQDLPGSLIAVLLAILGVAIFNLEEYDILVVGAVPKGLPAPSLPPLSYAGIRALIPTALAILFVGVIESIALAKAIEAGRRTYKVRANQELIALGLSKIFGAFFQAYPTSASFSRSVINDKAGAETGVSSAVAALLVILTLLFLTPFFSYMPVVILSSVIVVAVSSLINVSEARRLWYTHRSDFIMMLITFLVTLGLGIEEGILAGVTLSLALMIYRTSLPNICVLGQLPDSHRYRNIERFSEAIERDDMLIVRFDDRLYFGNANVFQDEIESLIEKKGENLKVFILDASSIHHIDSSGMEALKLLVEYVHARDLKFALSGAIGPVRDKLFKTGLMAVIGTHNQFMYIHDAVTYYDNPPRSSPYWREHAVQTNVLKND